MRRIIAENWKVSIGILISLMFLYLALRSVDFRQMLKAFTAANYWYLIPAVIILFFSHWLRALRWRYLLEPIRKLGMGTLFSSLLIGYMANVFLPAHLGEFIRAFIIGKKTPVSASAVFGTIVIERIIDVFTLLALMAFTLTVFPFPHWVRISGYICSVGIVALSVVLVLMSKHRRQTFTVMGKITKPLPSRITIRINGLLHSFLDGIVPLRNWKHYVIVIILSIAIWMCYVYCFQVVFYAFDFVESYSLPWSAALVLLVITTISIIVPSSPGYVGTYHFLCQRSLILLGVPASPALTYAFVLHGINFLPILVVGFILVPFEGLSFRSIRSKAKIEATTIQE